MIRRMFALVLCFAVLLGCFGAVSADQRETEATILFTHDLHSHFLPSAAEDGGEFGGYARLMTAIRQELAEDPDAILVDGGDFSMGSLFQTGYATSALELRMMGAMGYDATTFGNHEFDYLQEGLCGMLRAAKDSGGPVPSILDCNFLPPETGAEEVWEALDYYGVRDYELLERGGVLYALFGVAGEDTRDCAPSSGMVLEDPAVAAQRTVDAAVAQAVAEYGREPVVIALSHTGTSDGQGEDYELAKAVTGIDLIVSGHTHTTLSEPIVVNDTWIVSAGHYGKNLGVVKLTVGDGGEVTFTDYELIPINETVPEDPEIAALVEQFKAEVEENYLADYGMTFDQVLLENPYEFEDSRDLKRYAHESTLGNVFTDAYKWAVERATGEPVDVAVTAAGVVRETIPMGPVKVSDIFNAASLGVGTEGELISIYVTGSDLMNLFEVDASVYPLMNDAQLFCGGIEYSFNTNRMIFNKVDYAMLCKDAGLEPIDPDKLYRVVTGTYAGQMLGNVEDASMGLLTITPREADGTPIDVSRLTEYVVRDENGVAVKEWYAIASYMAEMGGQMDEQYAQPDGRKVIYSSWNPVKLLRNANRYTYILLAVVALLILLVTVIVRAVRRRRKNKKK